jgi:Beta-propeller repeat
MAARIAHGLHQVFVLLSLFLALSPSATHAQTRDWAVRYDGGSQDDPGGKHSFSADAAGNVYIAGTSWNGTNRDFVTAKYSPAGALLWAVPYDGGTDDWAHALAVDGAGNVYVTGASWADSMYGEQPQTRIVKYGPGGNLL